MPITLTKREVKFKDENGNLVSAPVLGGGSITEEVQNWIEDNKETINAEFADAAGDWLSEHVDPATGYVIDDSLTVSGAAADAKATGDRINGLQSDINNIYASKDITPTEFSDNHYIGAYPSETILGKGFYSDNWKSTLFIQCGAYRKIETDIPDNDGAYVGLVFYDAEQSPIEGYLYKNFPNASGHKAVEFDVPEGAEYIRISVLKANESSFFVTAIEEKTVEIINAINSIETSTLKIEKDAKRVYMKDRPFKALAPEFVSDFWCSNRTPGTFTGKNVIFTVSGSEGDELLTVSTVEPSTVSLSDVTLWTGFVLTTDGISYEVYNGLYDSASNKLAIYPPLSKNVANGTLASLYLDSGETYTGLHLTENGYKAYIYNLYNKNPKHCEVGLYNESFDSRSVSSSTSHPFSKIGNGQLYVGISSRNLNNDYLKNYFPMRLAASFSAQYTPYEQKNGLKWEVNLNGTSGYLEFICCLGASVLKLPTDQYAYVDVYIDGALVSQTVITDTIGKRICVDYENATTGKIEFYCNKFAPIDGTGVTLDILKATWWINEMRYDENAKLFPRGVFVAQEFDSWGVFSDGVTGETLQNLISADAGVTVPYENHSLGSQTTAWGLAWWYENVLKYHPSIVITDFGINDTNSVGSSGFPDTITGPDGKEYNNKITVDMYVENTQKLIDFAISNGIQPIVMRNFQHLYYNFSDAMIEGISKQNNE